MTSRKPSAQKSADIRSLMTLFDALYSAIHSLKNAVMVLPVIDAQGQEEIATELSYCLSAENLKAIRAYGHTVQSHLKELANQRSQLEPALADFPSALSEPVASTIAALLHHGAEVAERIEILALHAKRFAALDEMASDEREAFLVYAKAHLDALYDLLTDEEEGLLPKVRGALEPFEVCSILTAAARPALARAQALGVKVEIPPVSKRLRLIDNPQPLIEVLDGLFSNALDAVLGQAKVALEGYGGKIRVAVHENQDGVEITLTDNGCGIPLEQLQRLQQGKAFTSKGQGRGHGLPSARQRLSAYANASLRFESDGPGKGACAAVRLDLAPPAESSAMPMVDERFERLRRLVGLFAPPLAFVLLYWLTLGRLSPAGSTMIAAGACLIVAATIYLVIKGLEVRLVLFTAGLALASLTLQPEAVLDVFNVFRNSMSDVEIISSVCSAMGYAFILRGIGADQEMVRLLIAPVRRIRWLLVPAGCAMGFLTNMAITSKAASAAAVGPFLMPLMVAEGFHPIIAGATLVLGCSGGGSLFNPGEAVIVAIQKNTETPVLDAVFLPVLFGFAATVMAFTFLGRLKPKELVETKPFAPLDGGKPIHFVKALLPPLPLIILFLLQPRFDLFPALLGFYPTGLPVSHVMIVSTIMALFVHILGFHAQSRQTELSMRTKGFFEGMGYAYTHVISIVIAANCFVAGLQAIHLTEMLEVAISKDLLGGLISGISMWVLTVLTGSGTAPSIAFTEAVSNMKVPGELALRLEVLGAIAATFGRAMSPVAPVVIFASMLVGVTPMQIVKRTAPALAIGGIVVFTVILLQG